MAVPKRKVSRARRDSRSAHKALKKINVLIDKSGNFTISHIKFYGKKLKRFLKLQEKSKEDKK